MLHAEALARLARGSSLERGRAYAEEGRVASVTHEGGRLRARVRGKAVYAVDLWVRDDGLSYACTCPSGVEGDFCKHCVAVVIVWTDRAARPTAFAHVLHAETIARLARGPALERGRAIAARGAVRDLGRQGGRIVAAVHGTSRYAVSIWVNGDGLGYKCSCPVGGDGEFCKHCVAVAVAWLATSPS